MSCTLPAQPSLDQLKRQAKELLRAYRAGESAARQTFARHNALTPGGTLAGAQLVLAREFGFSSWPALKHHVDAGAAARRAAAISAAKAERQARRIAERQRVQTLTARLVEAARGREQGAMFSALFLTGRDMLAMRAALVEQGKYTLVIDALLRGVADGNPRTRFLTAQAMDHFADKRCAEPLRRLLHDPVPRVRWAALHSLACEVCKLEPLSDGFDLVPTLIELARHDPSVKVRRVAAWELGQRCPDARAVRALEAILVEEDDRTVQRNAAEALSHLGGRAKSGA